MRKLILLILWISTFLFLAQAYDGGPQYKVYKKSIQNMGKPDMSFSDARAALSDASNSHISYNPPTSKTCSQRCSRSCSVSCTTTRGCSTRCKQYTDGCDGTTEQNVGSKKEDAKQNIKNERKNTQVVYVTKSGKKYHMAGCSYLRQGSSEITLDDATKKGYTPCSKCMK